MANRVNRTWSIASAIAVAILVLGVNTANAHETSFPSEIFIDEFIYAQASGDTTSTGHITSPKEGCVPGRTVNFFAVSDAGTPRDPSDDVRTLLDTDRTSLNGAYYVEGDSPIGTDSWIVRVTRKNIGSSGHKHFCQSADAGFVLF